MFKSIFRVIPDTQKFNFRVPDPSLTQYKGYNVYIYDDNAGCSKDKLDITVPAWVVEKTLVMLANQKIEKDKINAQEVERDIMMMKEGSIDFTFSRIF